MCAIGDQVWEEAILVDHTSDQMSTLVQGEDAIISEVAFLGIALSHYEDSLIGDSSFINLLACG